MIHPRVNTVDSGNKHTLTFTPCWWWKGIHHHAHTLLMVEGIHPQVHNLLVVEGIHPHVHTQLLMERDTPPRSHPAVDGKGYTLTFTPCWWWKRIHPHVLTLLLMERDTPSPTHPAVDGKGYTLTYTP